jgi:hypothetical protein
MAGGAVRISRKKKTCPSGRTRDSLRVVNAQISLSDEMNVLLILLAHLSLAQCKVVPERFVVTRVPVPNSPWGAQG